jgi:hypothetical protein
VLLELQGETLLKHQELLRDSKRDLAAQLEADRCGASLFAGSGCNRAVGLPQIPEEIPCRLASHAAFLFGHVA